MRTILRDIPFDCDVPALMETLHVADEDDARRLAAMAGEAVRIARPKAMFQISKVCCADDGETVTIDDVVFQSVLMHRKFRNLQRVFPHAATCGTELYEWSKAFSDPLERYWADAIMMAALARARAVLRTRLRQRYGLGEIAHLAPGSLPAWPVTGQAPLFRLLGDVQADIGVSLTPTCLMLPTKSISGIFFATDVQYENCGLCPREGCPGRRMAYDPAEAERLLG